MSPHSSNYFPLSSGHFYCGAELKGNEARKAKSILHDPHDLIEENPIGQPEVAVPGTLGIWVHFHILTVERHTVLPLHHLLKQLNLGETGSDYLVSLWEELQCASGSGQDKEEIGAENRYRERDAEMERHELSHTGSHLSWCTCLDRWDLCTHAGKHFTVTGSQAGLQPRSSLL